MIFNSFIKENPKIMNTLLFVLWALIVSIMMSSHKFWFDEVVNLVYGIGADPVYGIHGNGHPAAWFLLLRLSYALTGSYVVLPAMSFLVASLAVWIFLFRSPFDLKFKFLVTFSGFALYEYVVMARNYGISMLIMFILAIIFSNEKLRNKYTGILLFILANTNIHSAILCFMFVLGWALNVICEKKEWKILYFRPVIFNSIIMFLGVMISFATVYPPFVQSASSLSEKNRNIKNIRKVLNVSTQFYDLSHEPIFGVIDSFLYSDNKHKVLKNIKTDHFINDEDDENIRKISIDLESKATHYSKGVFKIFLSVLIYAVPLCLLSSVGWMVSAYASLFSFSLFFQFIYPGGYRHQALWLVFVIMLWWIEKSTLKENYELNFTARKKKLISIGTFSLYGLLFLQDINGIIFCYAEKFGNPKSPAADFSEFFLKHPEWKNAIILDSPDYLHVPMFYYIKNKMFMLAQDKYGIVSPYAPIGNHNYDLDYVLNVAEKINYCNNAPVIMLFENDIYGEKAFHNMHGKKYFRLNRIYYFTADEYQVNRLNHEASEVAYFKNGELESGYTVYVMEKSPNYFGKGVCDIYKAP